MFNLVEERRTCLTSRVGLNEIDKTQGDKVAWHPQIINCDHVNKYIRRFTKQYCHFEECVPYVHAIS